MRKLYVLLFASLLICGLTACQKGSNGSAPFNASTLILGKWNLQKQKTVISANGVVRLDTTCVTSFTNVSRARFNKGNTFNSVGLWSSATGDNTNLGGNNTISAGLDSTSGTYSIVNSSLNITTALAGLRNMVGFYDAASSSGTVISPVNVVSRSSQITLLTSSQFNLHYELVYNTIINNVTTNYKEEEDYYYTR
ncbi:MAG TPA: hypothetical protein VL442_20085 [Mucilaginibacter sp.]|nr:hypothetical protein [Mucilaginibacter sp.]